MTRISILGSAIALFAMLAVLEACEQDPQSRTREAAGLAAPDATLHDLRTPLPGIADATEAFEALTEEAFAADKARLTKLAGQARAALERTKAGLDPATVSAIEARLADADAAILAGQPSTIALSAVEGYRLLVSEQPAGERIPIPVSLLDYAGFRAQADLKSTPREWEDAGKALDFAREQWAEISGTITDTALRHRFEKSLTEASSAVAGKNREEAEKAVVLELDLVDELETYFTAH